MPDPAGRRTVDVITTHVNADFDSLGAMVAAKKLYPQAVLAFPGSQEKSLRQFFVQSALYAVDVLKARQVELDTVGRLILVDVAQADRIGRFAELVGTPGVEIHVYDHHPPSLGDVACQVCHIESVGSATTILVHILKERRIPLQPTEATVMMLGIYEDTGCLTFSSTTPADLEAAAYLLGQGAELNVVPEFLTPELTAEHIALLDDLLQSRRVHRVHGAEVTIAEASADRYVGDLAVLAHKMRDMENLDALIVLVRMEDRVYLVGRSRVAEVDVSKVARELGGGGHPEAASATVKNLTLFQVRERVLEVLPAAVRPRRTARDVWTAPVKTVAAGTPLHQVQAQLNRYHINALPVLEGERLVGLVSRQLVGRALQHGLADVPVDDYMLTEFATLGPSAPIADVQDRIIRGNQRFLPIVADGRLLGAVTRTDLLRALGGPEETEVIETPAEVQERFAGRLLEERLEDPLLLRLRELGQIAERSGMQAYLVGGIVRDLLLRRDNLDVDVVVEGDGIAVAQQVAALWGATVRTHPVFGTAKVILPDGFRLDVATARTEYYEKPASLPAVEWSSLKLDLYRRDFTLNTLALRLGPDHFGEIIDFFGGLRDLKEGDIRILHNLSFVEDPTRVLRALRFQLRFGFRLGIQTRKLLRSAVKMGYVRQARGHRMFQEWSLLLQEADPIEATRCLEDHGVLVAFHPKLRLTARMAQLLDRVQGACSWYRLLYLELPFTAWRVYLLALLDRLKQDEVEAWARDFGIDQREGRFFLEERARGYGALEALSNALSRGQPSDSRVYEILTGCSPETLVFLMAKTGDEQKRRLVSRFATKLADTRPILRGRDLKELGIPPGKLYRELLDGLLRARLDEQVRTRGDEVAWVKKRVRGGATV